MTEHTGLPVKGYQPQSGDKVAAVNANKETEERILRQIETLLRSSPFPVDPRWLAIAKTHFEEGFMAFNRGIFMPSRIALPEDEA